MSVSEKNFLSRALAAGALLVFLCSPGHAARNVPGAGGEKEKWLDLVVRYPLTTPLSEDVRPSAAMLARWWDVLDDRLLTELVERALRHNKDMDAALARVREARAVLGIADAALTPSVNLAGEARRSRRADNAGGAGERDWYRLGFDASWEIDLFGRLRSGASARRADLEAHVAGLQNVWASLAAEVALNYVDYRALRARIAVAERNVLRQEETLRLVASRRAAGLSDELAEQQARYGLESSRAGIPPLRAALEARSNALSILAGEVPGSLNGMLSDPAPVPCPKDASLAGIPAEALRQRPDIREAERRMVAQKARKKGAVAELAPRLRLSGSVGLESLSSGNLLSAGARGFSIGPLLLSWPLFDAGALRRNVKAQGAREEELLAVYEKTVLNAVAEVRNALSDYGQERQRRRSLEEGSLAARRALELAEDRYRQGLSDFGDVLAAQGALLSLEDGLESNAGSLTAALIRLYKALGGGWAPLSETNGDGGAGADARL